jgi:CHAT domain-containing protein
LDKDEALLEYVLSSPKSFCLAITREGSRIITMPAREEIENPTLAYLNTITSKGTSVNLGRQLFDSLLKPLPDLKSKSRLIIVRDGQLHLLPFDALIDDAGTYIARTHTIVYAPSARAWHLLKSRSHTPSQRALLGLEAFPIAKS